MLQRQLLMAILVIGILVIPPPQANARSLEDLGNHEITTLDVRNAAGAPTPLPESASGKLRVNINALGETLELSLSPGTLFEEGKKTYVVRDGKTREIPTKNFTYQGTVLGDPTSRVRVALQAGALTGRIVTAGGTLRLEPHRLFDRAAPERSTVVYREAAAEYSCPVGTELNGEGEISPSVVADLAQAVSQRAAKLIASSGTSAPTLGPIPNLQNDDLERLDVGLVADYNFYANVFASDEDDTLADMQQNLNEADDDYRVSLGDTLTLRVPVLVVFETQADSDAELLGCARICIKDSGTGTEAIPNGNACADNSDCAGGGETCVTAPKRRGLCDSTSSNEGRYCLTNSDCTGGGSCDKNGPEWDFLQVCYGGADDGNACQQTAEPENCATHGNCCATGGSCKDSWIRQLNGVGKYRENGSGSDPITATNTGLVHLFTQCPAAVTGGIAWVTEACESNYLASGLTNEGGSSTASSTGVTRHEIGHNVGAYHDNDEAHCGDLWIPRKVCEGGADKNKFCKLDSDCAGSGTCTKDNHRRCKGTGPTDGLRCDDEDLSDVCDPPNTTCTGGPHWRVCEGGTDDGKRCDENAATPCTSPGTCTGPRLNWKLYYMGGGPYDFSPCSKAKIATWQAAQSSSCLVGLDCGDLNRNGTITATDATIASSIAVGSLPFDPLGDVVPFDNPNLSITTSDASYILGVAVGSNTAPTICGE